MSAGSHYASTYESEFDEDDLIVNHASHTLITEADVTGLAHSKLYTSTKAEQVFVLPQTVNMTAARDALLRAAPFSCSKRASASWKHIMDEALFQKILGATYHHFAQCFRDGKFMADRLYDLRNSPPLMQLAQTMAEMYVSFGNSSKKVLTKHLPEVVGFMIIHCLSGSLPRQQWLSESQRFRMITFDWCFEVFSGLRPTNPHASHAWFFVQQPIGTSSSIPLRTTKEESDAKVHSSLRARYTLNHSPLMELYLETVPYGTSNRSAVTLSLSHRPDRSITTSLSSSPAVVVSLQRKPLPSKAIQKHLSRASKLTKRVAKESRLHNTQALADIKASRADTSRSIRNTNKQERRAMIELQNTKRSSTALPTLASSRADS